MKCPKCDFGVNRTMKFCPECSQRLEFPASTGQRIEQFLARSLSLNVLYADFKVSFNSQDVVIFKIDGDEEMKESVVFRLDGDKLTVGGRLPGVEIIPHNICISIFNDTITINGKRLDKTKKLTIEISLPRNFELNVEQYTLGSMAFTSDVGNLVLRDSGFMSIEAKSFYSLDAYISGSASLTIDDVASGLVTDISGSGDLTVRSIKGAVSISVSGSGDVDIAEINGSLTANIGGSGDFDIKRVYITTATFAISGSGDVSIREGDIQTTTISASGMGGFEFGGHVGTGSFTASGMGDIEVDSCDTILRQKESGMGSIEIG